MLKLTRKVGQSIMIGEEIEVVVVQIKGGQVQIGIKAPKRVDIMRRELRTGIEDPEKAKKD